MRTTEVKLNGSKVPQDAEARLSGAEQSLERAELAMLEALEAVRKNRTEVAAMAEQLRARQAIDRQRENYPAIHAEALDFFSKIDAHRREKEQKNRRPAGPCKEISMPAHAEALARQLDDYLRRAITAFSCYAETLRPEDLKKAKILDFKSAMRGNDEHVKHIQAYFGLSRPDVEIGANQKMAVKGVICQVLCCWASEMIAHIPLESSTPARQFAVALLGKHKKVEDIRLQDVDMPTLKNLAQEFGLHKITSRTDIISGLESRWSTPPAGLPIPLKYRTSPAYTEARYDQNVDWSRVVGAGGDSDLIWLIQKWYAMESSVKRSWAVPAALH